LWFQRKAFLASGRTADAARQNEILQAFVREEGIRRHEPLAGALVAEAHRNAREGAYAKALEALQLAEALDPGRSQIRFLRAAVLWKSGEGAAAAAAEGFRALRELVLESSRNLRILPALGVLAGLALFGATVLFGAAMAARYHVPLRHEVEEFVLRTRYEAWGQAAGWAVLWLPALVWIGAGWLAHYWILLTFRFQRRAERAAGILLLLGSACAVPCYRLGVATYGISSDPVVRTVLAASEGAYDPDRIVRLRQIVKAHPREPIYRFLLAGLYKDGRYFEEAFEEYQAVLELGSATWQAEVNLGNIYDLMGQHGEAIAHYRKALALEPNSALAWFNLYVAQSEAFRLREAEQSLERARQLDPKRVASLMSPERPDKRQLEVVDARIDPVTVWKASLEGGRLTDWLEKGAAAEGGAPLLSLWWNGLSLGSLLALSGSVGLLLVSTRPPARRCLRCGRPFCSRCKSRREGSDYCSQCVHLFVLGDGLAPETRTRKLYEVDRFARHRRRIVRIASLLLPGAGQLLAGRPGRGSLLGILWFASALVLGLPGLSWLERALGIEHPMDLFLAGAVPTAFAVAPLSLFGLVVAGATWLAANVDLWRSREV